MKTSHALPRLLSRPVLPVMAACACLLAAGCADRDTLLAEKVAAADAAAKRAEAAALRAEAAAKNAENPGSAPPPPTEIEEVEPTVEDPSPRDDAPPPPPAGVQGQAG